MKQRNLIIIVVLASFLLAALSGCKPQPIPDQAPKTDLPIDQDKSIDFVDMEGRAIKLDKEPERLLIIGSALRLYTYIAGTEKLVGVERAQQDAQSGRPYIMAYPALAELPIVGEGFPNDPDPELMISVNPDLIIAGDIMDKDSLEQLEVKFGVPIVIIMVGEDPVFDETTYNAMQVIGKATGNEARVEELIIFMEKCKDELEELTKDIPEDERPTVYVGGISNRGIQGIDSTNGISTLMMAINANNVANELGEGHFFIDKEKLIEWDPEILILDENGLSVIQEDYQKNPNYYNALSAVKNGQVYGQLPYTSYYNNVETALADLYYVGKLLYPNAFENIDPQEKADEIYSFMLGVPLYEKMAEKYGGFEKIKLGE